jgi:hypothetical protein
MHDAAQLAFQKLLNYGCLCCNGGLDRQLPYVPALWGVVAEEDILWSGPGGLVLEKDQVIIEAPKTMATANSLSLSRRRRKRLCPQQDPSTGG